MSDPVTQSDLELLLTGCLLATRTETFDASKSYTDTQIAQVKTLIGASGEVDLSGITALIDSLTNAVDGDPTAAGYQILDALRTDLNAVIAKAAGNTTSINTLNSAITTGLASLQTALETQKSETATKLADLRSLIAANEAALQAEVVRATGVDAAQQTAIDTLKSQIAALQAKDVTAEECCAAVKARLDAVEEDIAELFAAQQSTAETLAAEAQARVAADESIRDRVVALENRSDETGLNVMYSALEAACATAKDTFASYIANASPATPSTPLPEETPSGSDSGAASSI